MRSGLPMAYKKKVIHVLVTTLNIAMPCCTGSRFDNAISGAAIHKVGRKITDPHAAHILPKMFTNTVFMLEKIRVFLCLLFVYGFFVCCSWFIVFLVCGLWF